MRSITIRNGIDPSGATLNLSIVDGRITAPTDTSETIDATGLVVAPGFIDLQVNGGWGHDFTEDPDSIWDVGAKLPRTGVTSFCPTIITSPLERITAAQHAMANRPNGYAGAEPLGLHIEGPFLSESKRGTHPSQFLRLPTVDPFELESVSIVTVAPELEGALDLIEHLTAHGVVVSIGHSAADFATASGAIAAGARLGTHLFNAMPPITGREPGIAGAILDSDEVFFGIIADGVHLSDATVRLAWRSAPERFVAITDAIAAVGMPDGDYHIGGVTVSVSDGAARNGEGRLAGSVLTMDTAFRNLLEATGAAFPDVIKACSTNAATAIGRDDLGSLAPGARGDVVLLDGHAVVATIVNGAVLHSAEPHRIERPSDAAS